MDRLVPPFVPRRSPMDIEREWPGGDDRSITRGFERSHRLQTCRVLMSAHHYPPQTGREVTAIRLRPKEPNLSSSDYPHNHCSTRSDRGPPGGRRSASQAATSAQRGLLV